MTMPLNSHYAKPPTPATPVEAPAKTRVKLAAKKAPAKVAKSKSAKKKPARKK